MQDVTPSLPAKNKGGRPIEWTEDKVIIAKELYINLLRLGKTEREIDKVEEIPSHSQRCFWQEDNMFSERCAIARAEGAVYIIEEAEIKQEDAYERAIYDFASPQLISIVESMMKHARWKASKYNKRVFGDRSTTEVVGDPNRPIELKTVTIELIRPKGLE